jgi:hypothetical protein
MARRGQKAPKVGARSTNKIDKRGLESVEPPNSMNRKIGVMERGGASARRPV